jgi:hypothetical protein
MVMKKISHNIGDGSLWPCDISAIGKLSYDLRYQPQPLTRHNKLVIAGILDAYIHIVTMTQKERNYKCEEIKKVIKKEK